MIPKTPHPLFDTLISEGYVKNDAKLGVLAKIGSPDISKMRNGKKEVSDKLRVFIVRNFQWPIKRVDQLAPPTDSTTTEQ